mmetsp:Transcript_5226/g.10308  ORF Transcript_5226/g.10308 Transcript_5226/m.10308 type:complete len:88 (-) Transcript_5226:115-378(-)|eukprot:scaffold3419_cov142-Amphora_coffeaeformis.AAC.8
MVGEYLPQDLCGDGYECSSECHREYNNVDLLVEVSGEPKLAIGTSCSITSSNICDYTDPDLTICCGGQRTWWSTFDPNLYVAMEYTG